MPIESYWEVLEPYWNKLSIDDPESFLTSTAAVPKPIVLLYAAHFSQSEVYNGGFLQFFFNSTGVLGPEAVQGFQAIAMPQIASLVSAAVSKLGSPYPRVRADRWDSLLVHSGLSAEELEAIFAAEKHQFIAFRKATKPMELDRLEETFFELIGTEAGGFEEAATRYASSLTPEQLIVSVQ